VALFPATAESRRCVLYAAGQHPETDSRTRSGRRENLASFCRLDYPEYEIVFCVDPDDEAVLAVLGKLTADFLSAASASCTVRSASPPTTKSPSWRAW
jgi:uncharacterized metal-binding protein